MGKPQKWSEVLDNVSLTARELEILHLKARRHTNAEIADALFISITTVKWHVRQIYNKLGVNNRAEATMAARQLGLLDPRSDRQVPRHSNLPGPATPFIGREQELHDLIGLLTTPDTHFVTITGPGGIGKTRLALQATTMLHDRFADKPCWVNFSAQDEMEPVFSTVEDYILAAILTAIGLSFQGGPDLKILLETYIRKHEILFILDSFEHLITGASVIADLLQVETTSKFLVTSRERLYIPGETLFSLQGLKYAQNEGDAETGDAVNLFLQTAGRVSSQKYLVPTALAAIKRICQRLEGMPLAIELAAEWSRLLAVSEIEAELDRGLGFLDRRTTGIRPVFDSSWSQLTGQQQAVFAGLSVFQRGFTREAAHRVADANLDTLSALFDKSLIQRVGEDRYSLHDLLRQYAAEQLVNSGAWKSIRDAHCAYFAALTADQREPIYRGDHSKILPDLDNIRAAWRWAVRCRRLEDLHKMLWPLDWFYNLRAYYEEAMAAMQLVIEALAEPEPEGLQGIVYGKALACYALEQSRVQGDDQAIPAMQQALEILRDLDARDDLAWPQLLSGFAVKDPQEREQNYLESLAIFEEREDQYGIAFAKGLILGSHYREQARYAEARQSIESSLAISRSLKDPEGEAAALRALGHLNLHQGFYAKARDNFQKESELWRGLFLSRLVGEALKSLGKTYLAEGKIERAEKAFRDSLAEFEMAGDEGTALDSLLALAQTALQQGALQKTAEILQDIRPTLERRKDSWAQARWWGLSGHISLEQSDLQSAQLAFEQALAYSQKVGENTLTETILDFAHYYQSQSDPEFACRLLGYAGSQKGLPAALEQWRIEPLRRSLAAEVGEDRMVQLLKEGAQLDQQAVLNRLADY